MHYTVIESTANEKIKHAAKLTASAKYRRENGKFVLEGLRLCRDAALGGFKIEQFYFTTQALERHGDAVETIAAKSASACMISEACAKKLSDTENSQGFFCLCRIPADKTVSDIDFCGKYIVLENIQDPANLGTVCRTAEALGISGVIVSGCCDIYSPKAQRASMGSLLRLTVIRADKPVPLLCFLKQNGMKLYSTTPDTDALDITKADMSQGVAAVIGNEGNGVTAETEAVCERITIPMRGRAESLNASAAAALTIWEMVRNL